MGITTYSKFDLFKQAIFSLSTPVQKEEIVNQQFLLEQSVDKKLSIYYAPVEYINENAKILIVGITPGFQQMHQAYKRVTQLKETMMDNEQILHQAKIASSYQGPMRKNLIHMLDELGLPHYLGLSTSKDLFGNANHLLHTTGLIPYPVFYKNKNYTGATPNIRTSELLKKYVTMCFPNDISKLNAPLIIPLGVTVTKALAHLAKQNLINEEYMLTGFPHPSGANGHRLKQFANYKEQMGKALAHYFRRQKMG